MRRVSDPKRIPSLLLSLIMTFSLCFTVMPPIPVYASEGDIAQITVDNVSVEAGETVTVDVQIANCVDFFSMILDIAYDKEAMTLLSISRGPATLDEEGRFSGNPDHVGTGNGRVMFDGVLTDGPMFYMTATDDVLFTLTFEISETAPPGDYSIQVAEVDFFDPQGQALPMNITNGIMTVEPQTPEEGEDDYTVSLYSSATDINGGETFALDVDIHSHSHISFYGATIEVTYDNDKVAFDKEASSFAPGFDITSITKDNITTLKIVGANESGYSMSDFHYQVAGLAFTALPGISTGKATFAIRENPIVNSQKAVQDQHASKGEDLSVNLWNLTVTFQSGGNVTMDTCTAYVKYNTPGLYTDNTYSIPFTQEPTPQAHANYTLNSPFWNDGSQTNVDFNYIQAQPFTQNAIYEATATENTFHVNYPDVVTPLSGITDQLASYGTDIVFKVTAHPGYIVHQVTYKVAEGAPVLMEPGTDENYTIPGDQITGPMTISVAQKIDGVITFIPNDDFKSLPSGYKVVLFTVDQRPATGAYEYDNERMFYSKKYSSEGNQVYLYVVPNEVTTHGAIDSIEINKDSAAVNIELNNNGDVNVNGVVNSTDKVLTHALYQGLWAEDTFHKVSMQMRLEADVNGDGKVDTTDAQRIQAIYWGLE
jgi:hypothetical protein